MSTVRCSRIRVVPARSAYAVPRKTMPTAARNSGTASVEAIDPNAIGYAVHITTSTNTSHTWFASHTGAIASCACSRTASPRAPRPASSCHRPAPKSAPPSTT